MSRRTHFCLQVSSRPGFCTPPLIFYIVFLDSATPPPPLSTNPPKPPPQKHHHTPPPPPTPPPPKPPTPRSGFHFQQPSHAALFNLSRLRCVLFLIPLPWFFAGSSPPVFRRSARLHFFHKVARIAPPWRDSSFFLSISRPFLPSAFDEVPLSPRRCSPPLSQRMMSRYFIY